MICLLSAVIVDGGGVLDGGGVFDGGLSLSPLELPPPHALKNTAAALANRVVVICFIFKSLSLDDIIMTKSMNDYKVILKIFFL